MTYRQPNYFCINNYNNFFPRSKVSRRNLNENPFFALPSPQAQASVPASFRPLFFLPAHGPCWGNRPFSGGDRLFPVFPTALFLFQSLMESPFLEHHLQISQFSGLQTLSQPLKNAGRKGPRLKNQPRPPVIS